MRHGAGIQQRAAHENKFGSGTPALRLHPLEKLLAIQAGQIEIAKHEIVAVRGEMRQRFFRTGRAFHRHAPRRKSFLHDLADAFFVVHHVDGMPAATPPTLPRAAIAGLAAGSGALAGLHVLRQQHAKFRAVALRGLHLDGSRRVP